MKHLFAIILFFALTLVLSTTCESNCRELAPYVPVDINLTLYGDLALLGPNQSITINGGVNGIIIYRNSEDHYMAFDRTCSQWPEHDAAVVKDETFDGFYVCPECNSKFYLEYDGQPFGEDGPAKCPLLQYSTSVDGNILHIYN